MKDELPNSVEATLLIEMNQPNIVKRISLNRVRIMIRAFVNISTEVCYQNKEKEFLLTFRKILLHSNLEIMNFEIVNKTQLPF